MTKKGMMPIAAEQETMWTLIDRETVRLALPTGAAQRELTLQQPAGNLRPIDKLSAPGDRG